LFIIVIAVHKYFPICIAKPIDLLAKYISAEGEVDAVEMHEPYTYLNGLTIKDLEDLIEDIKVRISHNVVLAMFENSSSQLAMCS
jgi:hypothetical protein